MTMTSWLAKSPSPNHRSPFFSSDVHPFVTRTPMSCSSCVWPYHSAGVSAVKGALGITSQYPSQRVLDGALMPAQPSSPHMRSRALYFPLSRVAPFQLRHLSVSGKGYTSL